MASKERDAETGDRVLGLRGFRILGDESTPDELILTIESTAEAAAACSECGSKARAVGRYPVHYRDLLAFGMPVRLIWKRRRWQCPNPGCKTKTWSEESDQMASGTTLTKRAAMEITTGASSGPTEGMNLIVKQVKPVAFGFNHNLQVRIAHLEAEQHSLPAAVAEC